MAGNVVHVESFGSGVRRGGGGPSPEDLIRFPWNDLGNAMRLILLAGGEVDADCQVDSTNSTLLYLLGMGWVGFNGVFWDRKYGEDLARKLAHQVSQRLPGLYAVLKVALADNAPPWKDFNKFATETGSAGKTSAMLRQAQSYLTVEIDAFDQDPYALNVENGTLKLRWTPATKAEDGGDKGRFQAVLEPHNPADRITRVCGAAYDPKAKAPLFRKAVVDSIPDELERGYTHKLMGYGSTGCAHEQAFFMFQGRGRDGKSTILDACRETLGSYGVAASPDTFLEGGIRSGADAAPDLIALSGDTRLAVLSEPKRGAKMNEGLLKAWTSGSPISARDLHSKPINFRAKAKLFFEMNSFVVARGDDDGIWRRVRPVLFRHQVPESRVDRLLPQKLAAERAGILNWLIEGVEAWLKAGALEPPESLKKVVEDYRRSSSPFGDWLAECCITGPEADGERELSKTLYLSFKEWSEEAGNDRVMSAAAFGNALRDRQIGVAGKNAKGLKYRGPIRLKTDEERAQEANQADAVEAARAAARAAQQASAGPGGEFEPGAFEPDIDQGGPSDWSGQ
ncbi:MAG: phage/plasmid primase, P4 family [Phenylobacterium sp.]|uniref:DNA primase family protein n=1 Tax=Phenylobacterium sp. TaxID=1871053 RepID=UPI0027344322|nr:phage/plasmid primase, P4 family [Phenylobacterium sp.]MDP1642734.1 phage/plasmid primase, P4 family [Phenylobacterium sp.]MDP3117218.1 phage/plasmid primase, P4 family [Phenylobacterium sp.]